MKKRVLIHDFTLRYSHDLTLSRFKQMKNNGVAQSVERRRLNPWVQGLIPCPAR